MKEIIHTLDNTGKVQWWLATITEPEISLQDCLSGTWFNQYNVTKALSGLNSPWEYKTVKFIPITENNIQSYYSRQFHRGYETDTAPFILRKTALPELEANIFNNMYREIVHFHSQGKKALTPGQIKWLTDTFGEQLSAVYNREFIDYLTRTAIERMKTRLITDIQKLTDNAKKFADFLNTI